MAGRPRSVSDDTIFEAVAASVTATGPSGLTLGAVADRVGLSAPALAQRFGSKRGLLVAFASREARGAQDAFAAARADHAEPLTALIAALTTLTGAITTREGMANNLAFLHMDLVDAELRSHAVAHSRAIRSEIFTLVAEAVNDRSLTAATSPEALSTDLYATYCGALITWAIDGSGDLSTWLGSHLERAIAPHRTPGPEATAP